MNPIQYKEAGTQFLLQAFLQRIVNSGGRIEREYGLGKMRTDLLLLRPLQEAPEGQPTWTRWQGEGGDRTQNSVQEP